MAYQIHHYMDITIAETLQTADVYLTSLYEQKKRNASFLRLPFDEVYSANHGFNRLEKIKKKCARLLKAGFPLLFIVNNGSSDGTREWLFFIRMNTASRYLIAKIMLSEGMADLK